MVGADGQSLDRFFDESVRGALSKIAPETELLEVSKRARREFEPELARWITLQHELRERAKNKFGADLPLFFTRKGLEQATPGPVARFRAERIKERLGNCNILDATCGIGADSLALARAELRPVLCDVDPLTLRCARENLRAELGFGPAVRADATRPAVRAEVFLADPDQRASGKRTREPSQWSPPLDRLIEVARGFPAAVIKLPPGLDAEALPLSGEASISWVSHKHQLYELTLWLGSLAQTTAPEAVLVSDSGESRSWSAEPEACAPLDVEAARGIRWIAEADPAVLRAGLLGNLAKAIGLAPLDAAIAYLGGREKPEPTEFARTWPVLGSASAHERPVRALLAEHDIGSLTVKKRGFPEDAETLARKFRGRGSKHGLLFVTRLADGHVAYLAGDEVGGR